MKSLFSDAFILFKPKAVISGDFYFVHQNPINASHENKLITIAAVDCTGHGVPGAFMSLMGFERLTDAVQISSDPSQILSLLNIGIKNSLHQSGNTETATGDGMDIVLCVIDRANNKVKYSGANRPLWIIRKDNSSVEEIKPTKRTIGGLTANNQIFASHEIQLNPGDCLYLFSDGYADQFSGGTEKKLMTKRFKEILLDIQHQTMEEQKHYLDSFIENWKADTDQVDDILVIGVKL